MRASLFVVIGALGLGFVSLHWMGCSAARGPTRNQAIATGSEPAGRVAEPEDTQQVEAAGARTFRLEGQGGRCEWRVHEMATGAERSIYSTDTCPEQLMWKDGQVYFNQGSTLFRADDIDSEPASSVRVMRTARSGDAGRQTPPWSGHAGCLRTAGRRAPSAQARSATRRRNSSPHGAHPIWSAYTGSEGGQWSRIRTVRTCFEAGDCWGVAHTTGPPSDDWQHLTEPGGAPDPDRRAVRSRYRDRGRLPTRRGAQRLRSFSLRSLRDARAGRVGRLPERRPDGRI